MRDLLVGVPREVIFSVVVVRHSADSFVELSGDFHNVLDINRRRGAIIIGCVLVLIR